MSDENPRAVSQIVDDVTATLEQHADRHDREGSFVADCYAALREAGFFAAGVPADLGGGGARHSELCEGLRRLAHACPSTALATSMHTHLVATAAWKHLHGKGGTGLLEKVASKGWVLVSTGAGDWLESNGSMERVDGGYRVTATKPFGSGSPAADVMITSCVYDDPDDGEKVLHFPVPFSAEGVQLADDWDTLGMRGTGSQTMRLEGVFVPDEAIELQRPREGWHPAWSVVLTVALPLIMAPYVGIAEKARGRAVDRARRGGGGPETAILIGEMDNELTTARLALAHLVANAADYDFAPDQERACTALTCKTIAALAARRTVEKAMEVAGGPAYFRRTGIERSLRDVWAGGYHPLPEKRQQMLTGRVAMGLEPV